MLRVSKSVCPHVGVKSCPNVCKSCLNNGSFTLRNIFQIAQWSTIFFGSFVSEFDAMNLQILPIMVTLKLMNKIETLSDNVRAIEKVIHSLSREIERERVKGLRKECCSQ